MMNQLRNLHDLHDNEHLLNNLSAIREMRKVVMISKFKVIDKNYLKIIIISNNQISSVIIIVTSSIISS